MPFHKPHGSCVVRLSGRRVRVRDRSPPPARCYSGRAVQAAAPSSYDVVPAAGVMVNAG